MKSFITSGGLIVEAVEIGPHLETIEESMYDIASLSVLHSFWFSCVCIISASFPFCGGSPGGRLSQDEIKKAQAKIKTLKDILWALAEFRVFFLGFIVDIF